MEPSKVEAAKVVWFKDASGQGPVVFFLFTHLHTMPIKLDKAATKDGGGGLPRSLAKNADFPGHAMCSFEVLEF